MARLQDIADRLGLSKATVSRALNDYPEVGASTRARVKAVAQELGYLPNLSAQRLATGQTGLIAMVLHSEDGEVLDLNHSKVMLQLTDHLQVSKLDLVFRMSAHGDSLELYQRLARRGVVDAMIVSAPRPNDRRIAYLKENGLPFVVYGCDRKSPDYAFYDVDNEGGFYQAANALIDAGHQRIAILNGPERLYFARQRSNGFLNACSEKSLFIPECFVSFGALTDASGYKQTKQMFLQQQYSPPSALLCASTLQAYGAYRALAELGFIVGQDVAVVAHDDVLPQWQAEQFHPPLSVVQSDLTLAAQPLAEMVVKVLKGENPSTLQHIEQVQLILRESFCHATNNKEKGWS
ncbi:substrate-binding domain-containing protein [Salinibius halmophilus]|uniref:substrate-binding domain-containing protein n=1 Tax=Salinibius halmophilus TaxID=1853216 RepID=UPI000E66F11D|nr:substrate-binding domain-containing protein [Salinibius halmophilus]